MSERRRKSKPIRAWGGFVDGQLDSGFFLGVRTYITPLFAVFKTRKAAQAIYEDVRRVEIREVPHAK